MSESQVDRTNPVAYGSNQTALLLLDLHTLFIENAGHAGKKALSCAVKATNWARTNGIQVIHCLMDLDQTPFPTCKDCQRFAGVVKMMKQNSDTEPPPLLDGGQADLKFVRTAGYVSALRSPGLEECLKQKGVVSLIMAGVTTSGCVARTAMAATDAEFVVTVLSDGCADPQSDVHELLLEKVLNGRGFVMTLDDMMEQFQASSAAV